jgi:hypothetical protein
VVIGCLCENVYAQCFWGFRGSFVAGWLRNEQDGFGIVDEAIIQSINDWEEKCLRVAFGLFC